MDIQTLNNIKQRFEDKFSITLNKDLPSIIGYRMMGVDGNGVGYIFTDNVWNFIQEEITKAEKNVIEQYMTSDIAKKILEFRYEDWKNSIPPLNVIDDLSEPKRDKE